MPPPRTQDFAHNHDRELTWADEPTVFGFFVAQMLKQARQLYETRLSHGGGTFTEAIPAAVAA
jgi:hypothetical protein